jgi:hypothetical protein
MLKEVIERTKVDRMGRKFTRKIAVCTCDACGELVEKPYFVTMPADKLTFCNIKCLGLSRKNGGSLAERATNTLMERYGVTNISQSAENQEKIKRNCLERYGVEHHTKFEGFKESEKKRRLEKFGVEHHWMLDEVKEKRKETWKEKYGVDNPFAAEEVKENLKNYWQEKYGVDNPFAAEEIKNKIVSTNLERYGVEHPIKNEKIHRKQIESKTGMDYDYYYNEHLPAFLSYKRKVWAVTKKQPLETLENYSKRGRGNHGYHVDHIISIRDGFRKNVEPEVIGSIHNLRMMLGRDNIMKGPRSDMNINELLNKMEK